MRVRGDTTTMTAMPNDPTRDANIAAHIDQHGWARLPLLDAEACRALIALYTDDRHFRSTVIMQRHNFGHGEHRYFNYPLPRTVQTIRTALYEPLSRIANEWTSTDAAPAAFPEGRAAFLAACHAAGQMRPTPLLPHYRKGDYNCLHQDLYGAMAFPFQATVMLSDPECDFSGGEFILVEQRPRGKRPVDTAF